MPLPFTMRAVRGPPSCSGCSHPTRDHMRIAWMSNAPWTPTGYGMQTKQVVKRLIADGHDVVVLANWGLMGGPQIADGIPVLPGGVTPYSTDIVDFQAQIHEAELVITLYDVWPLGEAGHDVLKDFRVASWVPIDHDPVPPKVAEWTRKHETIAMSRFGQDRLARIGVEADYIPHAIELGTFKPTESDIRNGLNVPGDGFLVMINAANIGVWPPRKGWWQMMMAFRVFAERHEDVYLYLHTALQHPRGLNLGQRIIQWGVPTDRVRIADQGAYVSGLMTESDLAQLYTAADVLLMTSMGEGFGIPAIEAQACGTPIIVTDFSAQPELLGAGWKVDYDPEWDYGQDSLLARPRVESIIESLEAAYVASRSPETVEHMRDAAVAKAAEYDADKVYDEGWRPWLAKGQEPIPLNREQRRRRNTRGA